MIAALLVVLSTIPPSPRVELSLDSAPWRFHLHDAPGAEQPGYNDSDWQRIQLPHTWNNLDGQDGGSNYYRGIGWYRAHFKPDANLTGRDLFLKFDGAATIADVFVNGKLIGEHRGNFAAFCFPANELNVGADNLLAVKVDNARNKDIPPLSGDFNICGGLYRIVHLVALNHLSITPLDFASPGVYIKQNQVSDEKADIVVQTALRNSGPTEGAELRCVAQDSRGTVVASSEHALKIETNGMDDAQRLVIPKPHLWNGASDPYLYRLSVLLLQGQKVLDRVDQPLGLRYFRVDPEQGLFLNGKHYGLHGVNRHQDRLNKGWAISPADNAQDFKLIREMGCTGIRLAHYQHPQAFYDLCDRGGLVVWAELPLVNELNSTGEFEANARQQLQELIRQNYNHPSILFWSLFNELHFPSGSKNPKEWGLIVQLNAEAHNLDSNRLTTAATSLNISHPVNFITDVIAVNRYFGWYGGKPEDWPGELDKIHRAFPNRCIGVSEYGAGASIVQHEIPPKRPRTDGPWHPEEWQCVVHEHAWNAMKERRWLWGTFLWNMFDFAVDSRHEGDTIGRNDKGMMTYDRKTRKDAFYFYKANWTTKPFVYITSRRFTPRQDAVTTVKVYSNCPSVELRVNGKSLGSKESSDHVFEWRDVQLLPRRTEVEAIAGPGATDSCEWMLRSR